MLTVLVSISDMDLMMKKSLYRKFRDWFMDLDVGFPGDEANWRWYEGIVVNLQMAFLHVEDAVRWINVRWIRRTHMVDTGIRGDHDIDVLMFHACFALLGRFVREELGYKREVVDSEYHRGYYLHPFSTETELLKEAIDLWCWYSYDLPIKEEQIDRMLRTDPVGYVQESSALYDLKNEKLKRLIDIKWILWI